jgi:hypothetical protein
MAPESSRMNGKPIGKEPMLKEESKVEQNEQRTSKKKKKEKRKLMKNNTTTREEEERFLPNCTHPMHTCRTFPKEGNTSVHLSDVSV